LLIVALPVLRSRRECMRHVWVVLASAALCGCDATGANSALSRAGGAKLRRDCKQEPAPDAKLAKDLDQLCSCTVAEIRSGDIAMGDGRETVTAKIKDAMATAVTGSTGRSRADP
jgi:hypothetical protein